MITDRFHCPVQDPAAFTFEGCLYCKFHESHIFPDGHTTQICKKNKDREDVNAWESAFLLHWLGMEYHIEIIPEGEI